MSKCDAILSKQGIVSLFEHIKIEKLYEKRLTFLVVGIIL